MSHDPSQGYEHEPIRGLPGYLPTGESILWQGAPDWRRLAVDAFHLKLVALWFVGLAVAALASGAGIGGLVATALAAVAGVGLLLLLAWASARATVYTITNRRVVLRIGAALPTCINIPFTIVKSADFRRNRDGSGDIPLQLKGGERIGFGLLWPHARPWRFGDPQPMLRAVPDAERVAHLLASALAAAVPDGRRVAVAAERPAAAAGAGRALAA